jgi:hypothetical protein
MTIRESLWKIISTIESKEIGDIPPSITDDDVSSTSDCDDASRSTKDSHDLPLSFGKQPPRKKLKKQKKKTNTAARVPKGGIDQQFVAFSETRSAHNLYMGYNEVVCLSYSCIITFTYYDVFLIYLVNNSLLITDYYTHHNNTHHCWTRCGMYVSLIVPLLLHHHHIMVWHGVVWCGVVLCGVVWYHLSE